MSRLSSPALTLCLTLLAFILRYRAAQCDLWLDELWSLSLVAKIHSAGEVFWAIPHANNHYLNSLWMYWLGQNASPLAYRMPAVLMGAASVPAAGLAMRRSGRIASAVAMVLFCVCYVMVEYGSQARGYAGLILSGLLAVACAREIIAAGVGRSGMRVRWALGLCLGFGFVSQVIMPMFAVGLALWFGQVAWNDRQGRWKLVLGDLWRTFLPSALLMAPTAVCLVASASRFDLGMRQPFVPSMYWYAYSNLLSVEFGIYYLSPTLCLLTTLAVGIGLTASFRRTEHDRWFYVVFLAIVPAIFFTAGLPNTDNMRYFLPLGIVFLLGLADLVEAAFRHQEQARFAALTGLAIFTVLNSIDLREHYRTGRGDYTGLVRAMGESGTVRYGTNQSAATKAVLDYYGRKLNLKVEAVPEGSWCGTADWLIFTQLAPVWPDVMAAGLKLQCGLALTKLNFPAHSISSAGWSIYHIDARTRSSK